MRIMDVCSPAPRARRPPPSPSPLTLLRPSSPRPAQALPGPAGAYARSKSASPILAGLYVEQNAWTRASASSGSSSSVVATATALPDPLDPTKATTKVTSSLLANVDRAHPWAATTAAEPAATYDWLTTCNAGSGGDAVVAAPGDWKQDASTNAAVTLARTAASFVPSANAALFAPAACVIAPGRQSGTMPVSGKTTAGVEMMIRNTPADVVAAATTPTPVVNVSGTPVPAGTFPGTDLSTATMIVIIVLSAVVFLGIVTSIGIVCFERRKRRRGIDARFFHHHTVSSRVTRERMRRPEAHRLCVQQGRTEDGRFVELDVGRGVHEIGEADRVTFGKAVVRKGLHLVEDDVGGFTRDAAPLHACVQPLAQTLHARLGPLRTHGLAQLICFTRTEPRNINCHLHELLLKQRHTKCFSQTVFKQRMQVRNWLLPVAAANVGMH